MSQSPIKGSATEQKGIQDFIEISGFLWDFKISQISSSHIDFKISHRFQDLTEISQDLSEISQDLTQISLKIS